MSSDNNNETNSLMPTLLGSASASVISRLVTHPLDTVKARLQAVYPSPSSSSSSSPPPVSSAAIRTPPATATISYHYRGPYDVLKKTIQTEGFGALYRGFGAVIYGGTPATVLYLSTYEVAKERLSKIVVNHKSDDDNDNNDDNDGTDKKGGMADFVVHFGSGMLAEAVSCIVFVPVDVVKERLQVQHSTNLTTQQQSAASPLSKPQQGAIASSSSGTTTGMAEYQNSWDALSKISRTEGILALYKGYGATLLSFGTFSGLFFLFYERLLLQVRRHLSSLSLSKKGDESSLYYSVDKREVPFHWTVICSCSAGAVASWLTSPLDMAKLRLQVQRGQLAVAAAASSSSSSTSSATTTSFQYRNVWHCLQHTYQTGGLRGLFRGAGARVLHFAPSTTVTMTSYETCRSFFARILAEE